MKILWILGELPIPPDAGGKLRVYGLLKQLAPRHEITAAVFDPGADSPHLTELKSLCQEVVLLPWHGRGGRLITYLRAAENIFSSLPFSVTKYCSPESERPLEELVAQPFDIIQCENTGFYRFLSAPYRAPRVLDTQNVEANIFHQMANYSRPLLRAYLHSQAERMANYETWLMQQYDQIIAVSEAEAEVFRSHYGAKQVATIPNGIDTDRLAPVSASIDENLVAFSGALDYWPNDDAAKFFLRQIWPKVLQQRPQARFLIIGKGSSSSLRALAESFPSVGLTGWVEDIRPHLARAAVIVSPVRVGGGTRLKILEAMALEKAVVSTEIGAEGLKIESGRHLLIADDPEDFAEKVLHLLANPAAAGNLGKEARAFVVENYSLPVCAAKLEEVWQHLHKPSN